jgi:naphthalene 1,2-dioxygenase ferredoxin reductase component
MAEIRFSQWHQPVPAGRGSIADAALKAGVPLPHACLAGECGRCKCKLDHGMIEHDPHAPEALSNHERAAGLVLACRARARSDVTLTWLGAAAPVVHPPRRVKGRVTVVEALTHDITRLSIRPASPLAFSAGQFARLGFPGLPPRAYSMANAPGADELEFHVRHVPGGRVSGFVAERLRPGQAVAIEGPLGEAHLREQGRETTVLVGGGSGLAPALSILRALLARPARGPVHLYHGVRDEADLYELDWLLEVARAGCIAYHPVLSQPSTPTGRRTGFAHQAVGQDFASLAEAEIYICGPPPMVEAMGRLALERGAAEAAIHADPFHAAPPESGSRGLVGRLLGLVGRRA